MICNHPPPHSLPPPVPPLIPPNPLPPQRFSASRWTQRRPCWSLTRSCAPTSSAYHSWPVRGGVEGPRNQGPLFPEPLTHPFAQPLMPANPKPKALKTILVGGGKGFRGQAAPSHGPRFFGQMGVWLQHSVLNRLHMQCCADSSFGQAWNIPKLDWSGQGQSMQSRGSAGVQESVQGPWPRHHCIKCLPPMAIALT
jgi:hypothetical protein